RASSCAAARENRNAYGRQSAEETSRLRRNSLSMRPLRMSQTLTSSPTRESASAPRIMSAYSLADAVRTDRIVKQTYRLSCSHADRESSSAVGVEAGFCFIPDHTIQLEAGFTSGGGGVQCASPCARCRVAVASVIRDQSSEGPIGGADVVDV